MYACMYVYMYVSVSVSVCVCVCEFIRVIILVHTRLRESRQCSHLVHIDAKIVLLLHEVPHDVLHP